MKTWILSTVISALVVLLSVTNVDAFHRRHARRGCGGNSGCAPAVTQYAAPAAPSACAGGSCGVRGFFRR